MAAHHDALLRLADDHLVLGHRLSELCGHGPMLEEDLAVANMALDLLGQARTLYAYLADTHASIRDEDELAYLRSEREYRNCLLVERPNTDFAHTMLRQFYFAAFMQHYWLAAVDSTDPTVAGLAAKAEKEMRYHVRHSGEWIIRLGDGTDESHRRLQQAIDALHRYTGELFLADDTMCEAATAGCLPDVAALALPWRTQVDAVFTEAGVAVPEIAHPKQGGRAGLHSEGFGHMLSDMQYLQRSYPGLQW